MYACVCELMFLSAGGRDLNIFFYIPELLSSVFWWVQTFLREICLWEKRMTFILCCGAFCLFSDFFVQVLFY